MVGGQIPEHSRRDPRLNNQVQRSETGESHNRGDHTSRPQCIWIVGRVSETKVERLGRDVV